MTPQSGPESSSRDKMPQRDDLPSGRSLRVVAIGGGTGLSTLLKGLKRFAVAAGTADAAGPVISELCAVVTVSDDGGFRRRPRKEFKKVPPRGIPQLVVSVSEDGGPPPPPVSH